MAAVVLFHLDRLPGGNLGVDAFFVLSGWLITTRLLVSSRGLTSPGPALLRFCIGRLRRLAPVGLLVLVAVTLTWSLGGLASPTLAREVRWTLGGLANWGTISAHGDYWGRFADRSPIQHFWSLAVEGQLYVLWALILLVVVVRAGRRRRNLWVGAVAGALAVASVTYMLARYDPLAPTVTYMDTLARAHTFLLGAVAASLTASVQRLPVIAAWGRRAAPAAVLAAVAIGTAASADAHWLYAWGYPAFAVAVAVIVVSLADGRSSGWLGASPLRWIGERSYGIYLWHWPVILLLSGDRVAFHGLPLDVARVGMAVILAALSYRLVETPIRSGRWARSWAPVLPAGAATLGVLVAVQVMAPVQSPAPASLTVALRPAPQPVGAMPLSSLPVEATPVTVQPSVIERGPVRVLVVGDSTAVGLAEQLIDLAADRPEALVVGSVSHGGCGLSAGEDGRLHSYTTREGTQAQIDLRGCAPAWRKVIGLVESDGQIDIVLVSIGPWDGVDIQLADGRRVAVTDLTGRRLVASAYRRFVAEVEAAGTEVVWVTPPDLHLAWSGLTSPFDDPRRWRSLRAIVASLGVEQVDLEGWLEQRGDGQDLRPDGVHLAEDAAAEFVESAVVPTIERVGRGDAAPPPSPPVSLSALDPTVPL